MIFGVDHLSCSVVDIDQAVAAYEALGFQCQFVEKDIPNHFLKKSLLKFYQNKHDIALMQHPDSKMRLELTCHGEKIYDVSSAYAWNENDGITLKVADVDKERQFWISAFKFQKTSDESLSFQSPMVSLSCQIRFEKGQRQSMSMLDSQGWPCLAFMTNALEEDLKRAVKEGATDSTDAFDVVVNGKQLTVALFRSPGGALGELIQIGK